MYLKKWNYDKKRYIKQTELITEDGAYKLTLLYSQILLNERAMFDNEPMYFCIRKFTGPHQIRQARDFISILNGRSCLYFRDGFSQDSQDD